MNVIVGSGVAGLTLALLLKERGEPVRIIEAKKSPAPLMDGFTRKSLFFDTGFHYAGGIGNNEVLQRWLKTLGLWDFLEEKVRLVSEEFHFLDGKTCQLPATLKDIPDAILRQFAVVDDFYVCLEKMRSEVISSSFMNPLKKEFIPENEFGNASTLEVISALNLPEELELMLYARCLLLGMSPHETSFKHYCVLSYPYFTSSGTFIGGGKTIRQAFLQALAKYDVRVECNSALAKVNVHNKKVVGVTLANGDNIECNRCFFTGSPRQIHSIMPENVFRPAFFNRIETIQETATGFMVFCETESNYLQDKVLYILGNDKDILLKGVEDNDPVVYISCGDPVDGRFPITIISKTTKDMSRNDALYKAWKQKTSQKLIDYIEQRIPELKGLKVLDTATPETFRNWVYGATGSLYGMKHEYNKLPLLPVTKLEGFYMAGQNILLPGLLGAMISSVVCAGMIFGHNTILEKFRLCN